MKMGNSSKFTLLAVLIFVLAILSAINFGDVGRVAGQFDDGSGGTGIDDDDNNGGPKDNPPNGSGGPVTAVTYELCGYAWGGVDEGGNPAADGGVGWVSFNSRNTGSGPSYAVYAERDPNSSRVARLGGYAWSPNIGWIKFGDLQEDGSGNDKIGNDGSINCNGSDSADCGNARIVFANPVNFSSGSFAGSGLMQGQNSSFRGWMRACAGTINGDCSSPQGRTDGWDGWISLDPGLTNISSDGLGKLVINAGYAFGVAWGSDVVGWLNFGPPQVPPELTDHVYFCDADPAFTFSVSGAGLNLAPNETGIVNVNVALVSGSPSQVLLTKLDSSGVSSSFLSGSSCTPPQSGNCSQPLTVTAGPSAGTFNIKVTGTSGTVTRFVDIPVTVSVSSGPSGTLDVSCPTPTAGSTEEGPVPGENKFYVNRPVAWRVNVANDPLPVPPLNYRPTFNGALGSAETSSSLTHTFTRTYTTIGVKTFSAEVTDSNGAEGTCSSSSQQAIIVVNPDFNEK